MIRLLKRKLLKQIRLVLRTKLLEMRSLAESLIEKFAFGNLFFKNKSKAFFVLLSVQYKYY